MMTRTKMLYARAGAAAIAAAVALSPTYALAPKPIIDLSKSPALNGKPAAPKDAAKTTTSGIAGIDERTLEYGGGALALLAFGAGMVAVSRSRRRRREEAQWAEQSAVAEERDPLFDEPMFHDEPAPAEATAFSPDQSQPCDQPLDDGSDRCPGESWVERAYRGPSPANPSESLKHRLGRAAFFDKREREVAAGQAEPIDPDAGLPDAMVEDQERELA